MRIKQPLYFLIATLALLFFTFAAQGEGRPFITKWKGEANKELKIPIVGKDYKLVIKKADGTPLHTEASLTVDIDNPYRYTPHRRWRTSGRSRTRRSGVYTLCR